MVESKTSLLKKYGKKAGNVVAVLSVVFIVYAVYKLGFDFNSITNWPLFLQVAFVSVVIKSITVYVTGNAWQSWLAFFSEQKVDRKEALCVYAKANIGKYLPGNVMHYVERNMFAGKLNMSQKKLAASSVIEVLGLITSAAIIAVCVSAKQLKTALFNIFGGQWKVWIILAAVFGILLIASLIWGLRKRIKKLIEGHTVKSFFVQILSAMIQYMIVLISLGAIMVALYAYMGNQVTLHNSALIISAYTIAWVLGFVIPGAPGGIGVRELVLTVLLIPVVGESTIVTLSIIHRLITIIGDFVAYLIMLWLRRSVK